MKVVVTGGAGYIGSQTCKELASRGHEVIVYDNLSSGHKDFVKWGDFVYGDIRDTQCLRACLREYQPDGIIHFAAFIAVGESVCNPGKYFSNNVVGALSVLEAMRDEGIKNIIVSSTAAVYGEPGLVPIVETERLKPINPYGETKLIMERMLADFERAHSINWMAPRYFNACGCDPEGEVGELHDPETHLIPRVIMAALGDIERLEVFGNDYPTSDGYCIRDYIHVRDLANAHILALEKLLAGGQSMAINLGTGKGFSVMEIIKTVEQVSGRKVPYVLKPRRGGDSAELVADNSLARGYLNWKPQDSGLERIVETALNFMAKRKNKACL